MLAWRYGGSDGKDTVDDLVPKGSISISRIWQAFAIAEENR
jgi:hypothetical protein